MSCLTTHASFFNPRSWTGYFLPQKCFLLSPDPISFANLKDKFDQSSLPLEKTITSFQKEISLLPSDDLSLLLEDISCRIRACDDPEKILKILADSTNVEKIELALKTKYPSFQDAIQDAKDRLDRYKDFLKNTEGPSGIHLSHRIRHLLECATAALEAFLDAFGVANFFTPSKGTMDQRWKASHFQSLIYFASFLSTTLLGFAGATAAAQLVPAVMATIAAASLIYPFINPIPSHLPEGENYSHKARMRELDDVSGRKTIQNQIAEALKNSSEVKQHPLLIGETGVGKTKTLEAFVHAVERGDYPHLAGKQIFYFSSGKLMNASTPISGAKDILYRIREAMGRHGDRIIIVFDEIHEVARLQAQGASLSEELKVMLDPGPGHFPHFIGMTTKEEFERHIHGAFRRRFKVIEVQSAQKEETIEILTSSLYKNCPSVLIEDGALEYLFEKSQQASPDKSEPRRSLDFLDRCLKKLNVYQPLQAKERFDQAQEAFDAMQRSMVSTSFYSLPDPEVQSRFQKSKEVLGKFQEELEIAKKDVQDLILQRQCLLNVKRKICSLAQNAFDKPLSPLQKKLYLLGAYYVAPKVESTLISLAKEKNLHLCLTKQLIDEVVAHSA
jgi:MoxR-like ATPase